ncbi:MAG TPA: aminoglycoside phosphotransferase family protein [Chitinophagaceae bacterium]|nr:aminoglycoside phosphotransferase family protein [Chitinophagaceae bacterium]
MKLHSREAVKDYLVIKGFAPPEMKVEPLTGGVSCSVWKVDTGIHCFVLKQALERLMVETEWLSDVQRIHREHEAMDALKTLVAAGTIPQVLHRDYNDHVYTMTAAEEGSLTWKEHLMQGMLNELHAKNAASILKQMHGNSPVMPEKEQQKFKDQTYFLQLRVDPFHRYLIQQYPKLSPYIQKLIDEVTVKQICLVHGDFSPKNMLVEKNHNIVLIDFEVAHWGNPVFDLAYCLGHLILKAWHLQKEHEVLKLIEVFLCTYELKVENLTPHVGLMLLARMDGKSPVNYIKDEVLKNRIRRIAISWIMEEAAHEDPLQNIQQALINENRRKIN